MQMVHLVRHKRKHTGDQLYACDVTDVCIKRFSQSHAGRPRGCACLGTTFPGRPYDVIIVKREYCSLLHIIRL